MKIRKSPATVAQMVWGVKFNAESESGVSFSIPCEENDELVILGVKFTAEHEYNVDFPIPTLRGPHTGPFRA